MLLLRPDPKGIDKPIQALQALVYAGLCGDWGFDPDSDVWRCYGRAYKNQQKDGYIPEVYIGENEYREVYYDDQFAVISFFAVGDERDYRNGYVADVSLIFSVDLSRVHPGSTDRVDEKIHAEVLSWLDKPRFGFTLEGLVTGIDNVYREFVLYRQHTGMKSNTGGIMFRDMHPLHCFRVNMNLVFQNSNC